MPCLDYESRIHLNICLPPQDRIPKKICRVSMAVHDIRVRISHINMILLGMQDASFKKTRIKIAIKLLRLFTKEEYFVLISNFARFRETIVNKIQEFKEALDGNSEELRANNSKRNLRALRRICNRLEWQIYSRESEWDNMDISVIGPITF